MNHLCEEEKTFPQYANMYDRQQSFVNKKKIAIEKVGIQYIMSRVVLSVNSSDYKNYTVSSSKSLKLPWIMTALHMQLPSINQSSVVSFRMAQFFNLFAMLLFQEFESREFDNKKQRNKLY